MPTDSPEVEVSVCVPVYRRHRAPNIASLADALPTALGDRSWELVVVLNGITPRAAGVPECARIVAFSVNRGVTVAWNAAAGVARGRTLIFANDDVAPGSGSLGMLTDVLEHDPAIGVAGAVGTMWDLEEARHLRYLETGAQPRGTVCDCDVVSGFLVAMPAHTLRSLGGFDEGYSPCGFEEVDLCTAVKRRLGQRVVAVAGVHVDHEFGISARRPWRRIVWDGRSERLGAIAERNREYFLRKWSVT